MLSKLSTLLRFYRVSIYFVEWPIRLKLLNVYSIVNSFLFSLTKCPKLNTKEETLENEMAAFLLYTVCYRAPD